MKMVGSGLGRMGRAGQQLRVAVQQIRNGRGILVFDDGWHKLATALWLFGPIREVRAWVGATEVFPDIAIDAPTTLAWEHENGVRGVWDITLAPDMYLRSDYYTNDERWEVTGRKGYARVNRCTGRGIQQPSLEVYADGRCGPSTPSTTTGPAASAIPGVTGCAGSIPVRAPCCGAARRPSTCCGSRWLPMPAAPPAA